MRSYFIQSTNVLNAVIGSVFVLREENRYFDSQSSEQSDHLLNWYMTSDSLLYKYVFNLAPVLQLAAVDCI